jgi:hypothetical protein
LINHYLTLLYSRSGFVLNHPGFLNQLIDSNHLSIFQNNATAVKSEGIKMLDDLEISKIDLISYTIIESKRGPVDKLFSEIGTHYKKNNFNVIGLTNNLHSKRRNENKGRIEFDYDDDSQNNPIKGWNFSENFAGVLYKISKSFYETSLFAQVISDLLGDDLIIPYNLEDRKKKFPKAFKELEPYMRKYLVKK